MAYMDYLYVELRHFLIIKQFVSLTTRNNCCHSIRHDFEEVKLKIGVPQDSLLICINQIDHITGIISYTAYANDVSIVISGKPSNRMCKSIKYLHFLIVIAYLLMYKN